MSQCPLKKSKKTSLKLLRNISFQDHVAMLGDDDGDTSHQRKKLRMEIKDHLNVDGVCGNILRSMKIPLKGDEEYEWHFLHPCAFLSEACKLCPLLGDMVKGNGGPRVVIYMDEIKPGNVLRPDPSRQVACWYWTLMNLPSWFHTRREGWFYFGCFPTKLLSKLVGGYSYLCGRMLEFFFEKLEPLNFKIGFPCKSTSGLFLCQAELAAILSDEKALKELWGLRGASGTKPCCLCQNILGHMPKERVDGHGWLLHYSCSDRTRFAKHTSATFQQMRDHLTTLASGRKEELNKMGQVYGLQYSASGVLWHPTLKQVVCPIRQTYYDWMHVLIASGGLAQYEINQFVKEIRGLGIALKQLDEFGSAVVLPKSRTKLPSTFFQDRLCEDDDSCIRGFASEMLVCISILSLFNETVLKPARLLPEHVTCFGYLADIMDLLGKQGADVVPPLRRAIDAHALLYEKLYPRCVKPKYHWLFHVPDNIEAFNINMSCFAPERKHRAVKAIAAHVFNEHLGHNITMRIGYECMLAFESQQNICAEIFLDGAVREIPNGAGMLSLWSAEIVCVRTARRLMTATGMIWLKDMVFAPSLSQLLAPIAFLEVIFLSGASEFIAQVNAHNWKGDCLFEALPTKSLLVWEPDFCSVAYTVQSCGSIRACLQTRDQELLRLAQK